MATDNSNFIGKVEIRQRILQMIGGAYVLDLFCGQGHIYRAVYKDHCEHYHGLDKTKVHDRAICEYRNCEEYVAHEDLSAFNVFDCDSYGNGWKMALKCVEKCKAERFAVFVTDGMGQSDKMGMHSRFARAILCLPRNFPIPYPGHWKRLSVARIIRLMELKSGSKLVSGLHANNGKVTCYYGLLFDKAV